MSNKLDALDSRLLEVSAGLLGPEQHILLTLLRALPEGRLEAKALEGSHSITEMFTPIHFVRLAFVSEDAPEFARTLPEEEWVVERDSGRIA